MIMAHPLLEIKHSCIGFPLYGLHPPKVVDGFLTEHHRRYRKLGCVKPSSPRLKGKYTIAFRTCSGPHTGTSEVTPAGKHAGQSFDHLGFTVLDEIYVVGKHRDEEMNTQGRPGDTRDRPNKDDLEKVRPYSVFPGNHVGRRQNCSLLDGLNPSGCPPAPS